MMTFELIFSKQLLSPLRTNKKNSFWKLKMIVLISDNVMISQNPQLKCIKSI